MQSSPRMWVLQPLSPKLSPSDLRSITSLPVSCSRSQGVEGSEDMVVQAQQVMASEEGDSSKELSRASTPSSLTSSLGSHCGFYSFVEDPGSPEAELNQAWMLSPQRQEHLSTLQEKRDFKLQSYSSGRKPESLFQESQSNLQYELDSKHQMNVAQKHEELQFRKEIIRSQAPKKRQILEEWSALEDPSRSPSKLIQGFSLCYEPIGSNPPQQTSALPRSVDNEQINFSSAREQFLNMERAGLNVLMSTPRSPKAPPERRHSRAVMAQEDVCSERKGVHSTEEDDCSERKEVHGTEEEACSERREEHGTEEEHCTERKEVHGAKQSRSIRDFDGWTCADSRDTRNGAEEETPIEREIRAAQEREENLRRLRGLRLSDCRAEMVQIKSKPLLSQRPQAAFKAKEKNRVSFLHEVQRQSGAGDKVVDHPDLTGEEEEKRVMFSDSGEMENPARFPSPCCPHRHSEETEMFLSSTDVKASRNHTLPATTPSEGVNLEATELQIPVSPPAWSPSSSPWSSIPTDCLDRSGLPNWSLEFTALHSRRLQGVPDVIQKEIEQDLRREEELRKLRESRHRSTSPEGGLDLPGLGGPVQGRQGRGAGDQRLFSQAPLVEQTNQNNILAPPPRPAEGLPPLGSATPSSPMVARANTLLPLGPRAEGSKGLTETLLEDFEERRLKLRLEDGSYAGIQPIDDVNNEVVEATRVTRHKNQQALRWEAGVFANHYNQ